MSELFPTADEIVLAMEGCFQRVGPSATVIYEFPDFRFDVADSDHVLDLAVADPKGHYVAVIVDVLAFDIESADRMMNDIEETCQIVRAKLSEVIGIVESSEADYMRRLRDSMELLASELRK